MDAGLGCASVLRSFRQEPAFLGTNGKIRLFFAGAISLVRTNHSYVLCTLKNGLKIYVNGGPCMTLSSECPIMAWCIPVSQTNITTCIKTWPFDVDVPDAIAKSIGVKKLKLVVPFLVADDNIAKRMSDKEAIGLTRELLDDELLPKKVRGKTVVEVVDITQSIGPIGYMKNIVEKHGKEEHAANSKRARGAAGGVSATLAMSCAHLLK
jgi:hypothetical protein